MADTPEMAILKAADAAETAEDELEVASRVYGIYELQVEAGERPASRISETAAFLKMRGTQVRRYVALHLAPPDIRELYRLGKLGTRTVELLQGLSGPNQRIMARRIIGKSDFAAQQAVKHELRCIDSSKSWLEPAIELEGRLQRVMEYLDEYLDMTPRLLRNIFAGAGGALGRRRIISLIDEQISLLTSLKQTLEPGAATEAESIGGIHESGSASHANSS
jgi:hypothetical protein